MKILDVNNMLDAARDSDMPDMALYQGLLEHAATLTARALAKHLNIVSSGEATFESGLGGLCANFCAASVEQECPACIHDGDPGGDWETEDGCDAGVEKEGDES